MKRFLNKVFWFTALLAAVNIALVTLVPADENSYLKEYLHKVRLLESTHGKRIIFVGGSSVAFGSGANYASIRVQNCGTTNHTFRFTMVHSDDSAATGEVLPPISRRLPHRWNTPTTSTEVTERQAHGHCLCKPRTGDAPTRSTRRNGNMLFAVCRAWHGVAFSDW